MKDLKVAFIDFWPAFEQDENIFVPLLSKHFNVIIDEQNPDVVFHSIFNGQRNIQKYNKFKKILLLGENYRPSQFNTNYSISFDPHSETNYRLPLWQYYLLLNPSLKDKLFNQEVKYTKFDRFCSFVVSNGNNFIRNSFYSQLSQYKFVNSYGKYLTNSFELQKINNSIYWRDNKNDFFNKITHKFSICFENTSYPGYCTEKIMDAYLNNSLPIYWGDPKVTKDWNENSFINVTKLGVSKSLELIKELDNNDCAYNLKQENCFTTEQKERHLHNINEFENWLINKILQ
jgi:alpha(1,3/1,4) fucosyltransferase